MQISVYDEIGHEVCQTGNDSNVSVSSSKTCKNGTKTTESRYPKVGSEEHEHEEEFELPTFSLLEEILIEEDSTKYTFSPPLDDDKLYPGASISTMYAVSLLVSWFGVFPGMSKQSFSHLLSIIHNFLLPDSNTLPTSYSGALRMLQPYLSPLIKRVSFVC